MDEGMIAAEAYMDKRTDVVLAEKNDLIESQAKRIEELEKTNTELKSRFAHLNFMLSELQRRKEPELARNCPVCGKPQHGAVLHGPNTPVYWHVDGTGDNCEGLPTENAELKEKIATLRATAELVEPALRDYVLAQSRMADRWCAADEDVKSQLWKDLHFCEALGREALETLEAMMANAAHPITNPTDSDGSGT